MHVVGAGERFAPAGDDDAPDSDDAIATQSDTRADPVADMRSRLTALRPKTEFAASEKVPEEPEAVGDTPADPEEIARREGQARDLVYRALGARDHSRAELRAKLAKRGFDEDLAERVLARFVNAGLVDDAMFAQRWVESRHRYSGRGRRALAMELRRKGIGDAEAAEALQQVTRDDERERAAELVERKLARKQVPEDRAECDRLVQRLVGMLGRRGYHPSLALSVVLDAVRVSAGGDVDAGDAP
ncbi:regulatory protein RecX [Tsukamurella sp. 8F]|uniref:regulatory protein RecX n=1 Tax=unclassified Tsukamurella TaxID=2633480 RepID=UPI0023B94727|nr:MULTISPECIES: regulatory protein RecX [unclassified Tsukamurella]MDF0531464.1 regulatory protein RecX [Tsukamurella sp. 8J]MDF0587473.1 regulatory protein RecX [Tsukamurella sp. 8F]